MADALGSSLHPGVLPELRLLDQVGEQLADCLRRLPAMPRIFMG
jgi:hypothetical protein